MVVIIVAMVDVMVVVLPSLGSEVPWALRGLSVKSVKSTDTQKRQVSLKLVNSLSCAPISHL